MKRSNLVLKSENIGIYTMLILFTVIPLLKIFQ